MLANFVTPEFVTILLREALSDTGLNVVRPFLAWARGAPFPWRDNLSRVTAPLLAVAGGSDLVIPPANVR